MAAQHSQEYNSTNFNNTVSNVSYFGTSDLGLAASLSASGFAVSKINKTNPRRVLFLFTDTVELRQQVERFWANELSIPATTLLEHIRQLKARMYNST